MNDLHVYVHIVNESSRLEAKLDHQDVMLHAILRAVYKDDATELAQITARLKASADALSTATKSAS